MQSFLEVWVKHLSFLGPSNCGAILNSPRTYTRQGRETLYCLGGLELVLVSEANKITSKIREIWSYPCCFSSFLKGLYNSANTQVWSNLSGVHYDSTWMVRTVDHYSGPAAGSSAAFCPQQQNSWCSLGWSVQISTACSSRSEQIYTFRSGSEF